MKTFNLSGMVTISVYTKVEAETIEEAIKTAEERSIEKSQWGFIEQENEYWVNDEYDGEVTNIKED